MKSKSILKEYVESISNCDSKQNLKIELTKVRSILKNNRSFAFFLNKNKSVYEKILQLLEYKNSISETVYRLINDIEFEMRCECGKPRRYINNNIGYNNCTNMKCDFLNEKRNKSSEITFSKKYGGHPMKLERQKDILKLSMINIYGVDNYSKTKEFREKIRLTFDSMSNEDKKRIRDKIKNTNFKKYGGHPMQTDDVFINNLRSRVKFKKYILPSGAIIKIQGYENHGLDYLLKIYNESDIIYNVKDINEEIGIIYYIDKFGKKRRYYPDFYIKSIKKIYEVKSTWTYKCKLENNLIKKDKCIELGMKFNFLIYNRNIIEIY